MIPRRIVMASEFWSGSSGLGLAHGFRQLGHCVAEVDFRDDFITGRDLLSRVASRVLARRSAVAFQQRVLAACDHEQAEILVTIKGSYLPPSILKVLRERQVFLVNFYPDVSFAHGDFSEDWLPQYDLIATSKRFHLPWLKDRLAQSQFAHVDHGYSTSVHRRKSFGTPDFEWDLCYVGNPSPGKIQWLAAVAAANRHRSFLIAGNGWERLAEDSRFAKTTLSPATQGDAYARVIENSRINLGIHYGPVLPEGWEDAVSTRTFEIPACGGFMLHIDNPEVRTLFEPGREIDVFASPGELNEKIGWYLDHADERIAMAAAGHSRCVPAYSYDARAAELMALIEERLPTG